MKKILLSLMMTVTITSVTSAQMISRHEGNAASPAIPSAAIQANGFNANISGQAKADESNTSVMDFCYCHSAENAFSARGASWVGGAMFMSPAVIKKYAGAKVRSILIHNFGSSTATSPTEVPITVFCSNSLGGEEFVTIDDKISVIEGVAVFESGYTEFKLAEPFVLEAGKTFYAGFTAQISDGILPCISDDASTSEPSCYLAFASSKEGLVAEAWKDYTEDCGNLCIKVRIEGEDFPVDMASLTDFLLPSTVTTGSAQKVQLSVRNDASNDIENVGVTYSIDGGIQRSVTIDFASPIGYNQVGLAELPITFDEENPNTNIKILLDKVNGYANGSTGINGINYEVVVLDEGNGFPKATVIEEQTSIGCGWCPYGIVGMETLREQHPDGSFIGIAIHSAFNGTSDPMACTGYSTNMNTLLGYTYPIAMVNRDLLFMGTIYPLTRTLEQAYNYISQTPSVVKIDVTGLKESTRNTDIEATITFACDMTDADYNLNYTVLEDNVGPYDQLNYYSGGTDVMAGWESKPSPVSTLFNDVPRWTRNFYGVDGSVPTEIEAGKAYDASGYFTITSVRNKANARYVITVINNKSGRIENAVVVPAGWTPSTAIDEITDDAATDAPVRYFDVTGRRVLTPAPGQLLIRTTGDRAEKIVY